MHKEIYPVLTAAQGQVSVVQSLAPNTTPPLAYTFTNLYNSVALGGTPATFENSISYQTGLALSNAYYSANGNTWIAGDFSNTLNYLTAFGENIATASASAQTGPNNAPSLKSVYPTISLEGLRTYSIAFVNADTNAYIALYTASLTAAAVAVSEAAYATGTRADVAAAYVAVVSAYTAAFASPAMFTAAYAAAFAKENSISYATQASNYTKANNYKASPSTNAAKFASVFAKQTSIVLTAVSNYTGTAPATVKAAAYAAAYAELYLSAIAKPTSISGLPVTSYANVNEAIAAGITESVSSTATDILSATKDAVASASVIMAANLGYNYVDVSEIFSYSLQALAYSNPAQYLANLQLFNITPQNVIDHTKNPEAFDTSPCCPLSQQYSTDNQSNFNALFSLFKLISNTYAWFLSNNIVTITPSVEDILTINGTFKTEYNIEAHGSELKINVADLSDISVQGAVTLTTPMPVILTVNGTETDITQVTGLTVVNSGEANSLSITGSLVVNSATTGNYITIGESIKLNISEALTFDGKDQGSINVNIEGEIRVVNDIIINNNHSSDDTPILNRGTIISTAGAITMNNNNPVNYNPAIVNYGTISAINDITMNNNSGSDYSPAIVAGTIKTNGVFNLSISSNKYPSNNYKQRFDGNQTITNTSDVALSFSKFAITVDGTLFTGTYANLNTTYEELVTLQIANQS